MSRDLARSVHDDYDAVEAVFIEAAKDAPLLRQGLGEASNPALYAYEQGRKIQQMSQDPEKLREQIRAEVRAEIEAEQSAKSEKTAESDAKKREALTPSLANAGNAGLDAEAPPDLNAIAEMTGEDATHRARKS